MRAPWKVIELIAAAKQFCKYHFYSCLLLFTLVSANRLRSVEGLHSIRAEGMLPRWSFRPMVLFYKKIHFLMFTSFVHKQRFCEQRPHFAIKIILLVFGVPLHTMYRRGETTYCPNSSASLDCIIT